MAKRWFEADLEKVADLLAEAKEIIDGLRDEQQEKLDNVPENLQGSSNYEIMESRGETFDEIYDSIESLEDEVSEIE